MQKWLLNHPNYGNNPWDVQLEALRRSEGHDRFGYFIEMGMGKSALTLNDFLNSKVDLCVVFVPTSFRLDWALLPGEWGVDLKTGYWPRDPLPTGREGRYLYVINFEAVRTSAGRELLPLFDRVPVFLVVDESSAIKNPQSQQAKRVIEFSKRAAMVRELNGTPMAQNVLDLYAQLRVLGELNGVNPYVFRNRYAVMGGYMGRQIKGMQHEDELYAILDRCSFRALKADWRDLPPKVYQVVHLEMTTKQRQYYREMLQDFVTLVSGLEVSAQLVLTQMGKLRAIASGFVLQDGKTEVFEGPDTNPKIKAIREIIEGGPGKTVISHVYKASAAMLVEALADYNPVTIQGGLKPEEVIENKRRFNEDPACRVLIGQVDATHRGHTLLGGPGVNRANRMIFMDNSFSYLHRAQIEDRIHRGEQDQTCNYYDLVTSPIDQAVLNALLRKKSVADSVDEIIKTVRSL